MSHTPITFVVPGYPTPAGTRGGAVPPTSATAGKGILKQSITIAARRGEGGDVRVSAVPGEDVVVLHIDNGPSLTLHPENARDLLLAQSGDGAHRGAGSGGDVRVPAQLRWRGLEETIPARGGTRGRLGDVLLKGIDVIKDAASDFVGDFLIGKAQSFAASRLVQLVDEQVDEAVYALQPDSLPELKTSDWKTALIPRSDGPVLVLVHGTFSTTSGTFSKLWSEHSGRVERLFTHYSGRVFALDHRTLGASPIANALTLARALPEGCRLNLVTHSRGGLVGEVLARACAAKKSRLDAFKDEAQADARRQLEELIDELHARRVKVERLVRVACPARGTLLASRRLDAYLSVLRWTLQLAGIPIVPALVDFINGVAQHRADPGVIPGLAAQIPDSPLVQWLHAVDQPIAGELRVVAGDLQGDSITSWLKTLLADAFYWTDNDLVVQTRSMYGGSPRAAAGRFALDRGGTVSHFGYFGNAATVGAIVSGLTDDAPDGFRTIGPLSYAGKDSSGVRAARRGAGRAAQGRRPALILIPGVFGSHLKVDGQRAWLNWAAGDPLARLQYGARNVQPDGLVEEVYSDLSDFLDETHEVIEFAYDWRRPIGDAARMLAEVADREVSAREGSGQPVRFLAHSTGGLVLRVLHLDHDGVWQRCLAHPEARVLMLGAPHAGFWLPMQLLSGDDTLGESLSVAGPPFQEQQRRQIVAGFPGLLQLQAGLLDERLGLDREKTWQELASADLQRVLDASTWHTQPLQRQAVAWGVPRQDVLDEAVRLRRRLDAQERQLRPFADRILAVAGGAALTPYGFEVGSKGLTYLYSETGDGRVTREGASLPGVRTWAHDSPHAKLPSSKPAFDAYVELLERGTTDRLPTASDGAARGAAGAARTGFRARPARMQGTVIPPTSHQEVLGAERKPPSEAEDPTMLRVTVVNGDLAFVQQPFMIGHYRSSKLTGTEKVMDGLIGHTMKTSLDKGQYPDGPGTHQVFVNTCVRDDDPRQLPRPEAVVVVGLGEEGKLKPAHLIATVRQGVLAWAQRLGERPEPPDTFELAATLIGSGGIGMGVGQSAQLVVQGVREANERLAERSGGADGGPQVRWPRVSHLFLIELYLDRATEAWRALRMTPDVTAHNYKLTEAVQSASGALPRPFDSSYRGADYDFIRAESREDELGQGIAYTIDTKRARTEDRPQPVQRALLTTLIEQGANDQSRDKLIGHTLFRLLVPVEMEPLLTGDTEAQIEVDAGTAGIPWELLEARAPGGRHELPWSIRTKLLRKLRTSDFRAQVSDATAEASVLIIGEPECDSARYPRLPGARAEALAVRRALLGPAGLREQQVRTLVSDDETRYGPDARAVINAVLERDWRIVHIAGHGDVPEEVKRSAETATASTRATDPLGVVLSNEVYLGPREINSMRTIPELVFVNCCYLAARNPGQLLTPDQAKCASRYAGGRPRFASGVADALIKAGVRCVIAAGWAVDDHPAMVFAETFYQQLLRGHRFIDAVAEARKAAWDLGGNTWAAYQCYGDPDWLLQRTGGDPQRPSIREHDEFDGIASDRDLVLALETIAVRCKYQHRPKEGQQKDIQRLQDRSASAWGHMGRVAEAFGMAWLESGNRTAALEWFTSALQANDGGASVRAIEQRANLQVRAGWEAVNRASARCKELEATSAALPGETAAEPSPDAQAARRDLDAAIAAGRDDVAKGIGLLEKLVAVETSMERESLLGSAFKRRALIAAIAGDSISETAALEAMKKHYGRAEEIGRSGGGRGFYYPAINRLAAEFALDHDAGRVQLDAGTVDAIRQDLDAHVREKPDFWNVVSQTELDVYEALARGDLASSLDAVLDAYTDLHRRVGQQWMWASVYDQAEFVLPKYAKRAPAAEQEAATRLIAHLRTLAGGTA